MRDTIVFDLDGTLVHSAPDLARALNHTLSCLGAPPLREAAVTGMIGGGMAKLFERALAASDLVLSEAEFEAAYRAFETRYAENAVVETKLYPDTARVLDDLFTHGLTLAVCTNKLEPIARYVLEALGVADRFAAIVGGGERRPCKPDPGPLIEILAALGSGPDRAAMVGDSEVDLAAARAASVPFVHVTFGYGRASAKLAGADAQLSAMRDLPRTIAALR